MERDKTQGKTIKEIKQQQKENRKDVFFNIKKPEVTSPAFEISPENSINSIYQPSTIKRTVQVEKITTIEAFHNTTSRIKNEMERVWGPNPINLNLGLVQSNNIVDINTKTTSKEVLTKGRIIEPIIPATSAPIVLENVEVSSPLQNSTAKTVKIVKQNHLTEVKTYTRILTTLLKRLHVIREAHWFENTGLHNKEHFLLKYKHDLQEAYKIFKHVKKYRDEISFRMEVNEPLESFFDTDYSSTIRLAYKHVKSLVNVKWVDTVYGYRETLKTFQGYVQILYTNIETCLREVYTYTLKILYTYIKNREEGIRFIKYIEDLPNKDDIYKDYNLLNMMCRWLKIPTVEGLIYSISKLGEPYETKYISFITYILKDQSITYLKEKLLIDPSKGFLLLVYYYNFDAGHSLEKNYKTFLMLLARFLAYMESPHSDEKALENFAHKYTIKNSIINKIYGFFENSGKIIITDLLRQKIYGDNKPDTRQQAFKDNAAFMASVDQGFQQYCAHIQENNNHKYCLYPTLNLWHIINVKTSFSEDRIDSVLEVAKTNVYRTLLSLEKSILVFDEVRQLTRILHQLVYDPLEGLLWICYNHCYPYHLPEKNYHRLVNIVAKCAEIARQPAYTSKEIREYFKKKKPDTEVIYKHLNELKPEILSFMLYNPEMAADFKLDRHSYKLKNIDEKIRILTLGQSMFIANPMFKTVTYTSHEHIKAYRIYCLKEIMDIDILHDLFNLQKNLPNPPMSLLPRLFFSAENLAEDFNIDYNQLSNYNKKHLLMFLLKFLPENVIYCLIFDTSHGYNLMEVYSRKIGYNLGVPWEIIINKFLLIYGMQPLKKLYSR